MFSGAPLHVTKKLMKWKREKCEKWKKMKKSENGKKTKDETTDNTEKIKKKKKRRRRGGRGRDETTVQPRPGSGIHNRPSTNHIVHDRCVRVKVCDVFARELELKHKGQNVHKSAHGQD